MEVVIQELLGNSVEDKQSREIQEEVKDEET